MKDEMVCLEPFDWRYSAAIVGLRKYLEWLGVDEEPNLIITEDTLEYNKKYLDKEDFLKFAEYYFKDDMHHIEIENKLKEKNPTEDQINIVNEKMKANTILKNKFKKIKFDGHNQDEIQNIIDQNREEIICETWIKMIQDHTVNILGWIQYEKVKWLQNNNPEVPGLVYKLTPTEEKVRKLKKVRDLWQDIMEVQEIRDVFTGQPVKKKKYDIDHFIPWSFVMNDELWNLMPMDASLNSSKSNRLPKWNPFFQNFAQNQYLMYQMIYDDMGIYNRFKGCYKDNLHSIWAGQELYRKGNSKEMFYNILEKNMIPVYDSARRQGYEIWDYS